LPGLLAGLREQGYRLVTVSELLANPALQAPSPARRLLRRLQGRLGMTAGSQQPAALSTQDADVNGSPPLGTRGKPGDREHLVELLGTLSEGVEGTENEAQAGPAERLIR